jgi:hypothetical protein
VGRGVLRGEEHLRRFERDLIETAIAEGSAEFTAVTFEPLGTRVFVERGGRYFRLSRTVTAEREVEAHQFDIDAITTCHGKTPTVSEEPVAFETLSEEDRRVFTMGLWNSYENDQCFLAGRTHFYPGDAAERSTFVTESPTFVAYEDDTYRVVHEGTRTSTRLTFRFEATLLGESLAAYAEAVVPEVVWDVESSALPSGEREFLAELVETGHYRKGNPIPEYVDGLKLRILRNTYPGRGLRFIRYEGQLYGVRISEAMS